MTPRPFRARELNKSAGILDDYAVRKNVATREGTVEKVPVNPSDIVNKAYLDAQIPVAHAATTGQTVNDHHAQLHKNTHYAGQTDELHMQSLLWDGALGFQGISPCNIALGNSADDYGIIKANTSDTYPFIRLDGGHSIKYEVGTGMSHVFKVNNANAAILGASGLSIMGEVLALSAGLGNATDYIAIDADGIITLHADARASVIQWVGFNSMTAPTASPATYVDHGISGAWEFADATDDTVVFNMTRPLDMDLTQAYFILLMWSTNTAVATETAVWQVEYLWTSPAENVTAAAQGTITVQSNALGAANRLVVAPIVGMDLPSATDIILHCRVKRLGADPNDDLTDTAELMGVALKYTKDKLGEPL